MAIPVKIKRRDASNADDNAPGSLLQGELAFNEHSQVLHYGRGSSPAVVAIGGPGYLTRLPASTGFVVVNAARSGATMHTTVNRSVAGTANEIGVTNGDGVSGNPTIGIVDNVTLPGTAGVFVPQGTTAQQVDTEGYFRYNTDDNIVEWYNGSAWVQPGAAGGEANVPAFQVVTGDTGTATADADDDTIAITGSEGVVTAATAGASAALDIQLDIASLTNEDPNDATDEFVFDNGTNHRAVDFLTLSEKLLAKRLVFKDSVVAATDAAGTLASSFENGDTIDGVVLVTGERILIKDQAAPAENGVYTVNATGAPTRATDFDGDDEAELGMAVLVQEGTANVGTMWFTSVAPATVGTNTWTWAQAGGSAGSSFETFTPDSGGDIVADSATDTFTLTGGEGITTVGTPGSDQISVDLDINPLTGEAPDANTDEFVFYNGANNRKVGFTDLAERVVATKAGVKEAVRAATTVNGTLATAYENADTIDGVTLATNDRILIKDQTTASENGIYIVQASGAPVRATDADDDDEAELGMTVLVREGTVNGSLWYMTTTAPATVGTNDWDWQVTGSHEFWSRIDSDVNGDLQPATINDTLVLTGGEGLVTTNSAGDTVTFDLDFSNMTSLGAAPATGDLFAVYDLDASSHKEMSVAELFTSPALTSTPTAPTAANGTNTTQIATTAYVLATRLDQLTAPTATVDLNSQLISNLATPTADTHAATKGYVDALAQGLDVKASVRVNSDSASTEGTGYSYTAAGGTSARGQITFSSGPTTIDGVSLANDDRILITETGAAGGIWVRTAVNTWDRATDMDEDDEATASTFVFVEEGTAYADSGWTLTTNDTIILGGASGTSLAWAQFSGAGQITAGDALTKTGNTLDVAVDDVTIEITTDSLNVKEGTANQVLRTNAGATAAEWGAIDISAAAAVTGALGETNGGTGTGTYTTGDVLYASAANTLSKLPIGATGNMLEIVAGVPAWATNVDGGTF